MNTSLLNFKDDNTKQLSELIEQIMTIPEESLTEERVEIINGMISGAFTSKMENDAVEDLIKSFEEQHFSTEQAKNLVKETKNGIEEIIKDLKPSTHKKAILDAFFNLFYNTYEKALEKYHSYSFELPIKLDEGAQIPTYAHESDAAADIYSLETITIKAHTISNKIRTGIHVQLPQNWCARIIPRSSTGAKTPLRLSNCQGLIDQGYTGEILVFYDNISDSDYTINAGDRIAQMWVEPIYRFKAKKVDTLQETDRNDGGFGSTGK